MWSTDDWVMSSIEKKEIYKQKLAQIKEVLKEHMSWMKKINEANQNIVEFSSEGAVFEEEMNRLSDQIDSKVNTFLNQNSNRYPDLMAVYNSKLVQTTFDDLANDYFQTIRLGQHLAQALFANRGEIEGTLLENRNATLEQIQAIPIPNFDWAKNNYHPSHFEVNLFKEKMSNVMKLVVEKNDAIDIEIGKIERAAGARNNEIENEAE